jgi:hypothetical protein
MAAVPSPTATATAVSGLQLVVRRTGGTGRTGQVPYGQQRAGSRAPSKATVHSDSESAEVLAGGERYMHMHMQGDRV